MKALRKGINLSTVIAIVSLITMIVVSVMQLKEEHSELTVSLGNVREIGKIEINKNFKSEYYYNEKEIENIIEQELILDNTGELTIIGQGSQKNIIQDSIVFNVREGYKLYDYIVVENQAKCSFKIDNFSQFIIIFDQWRKKEIVKIRLIFSNEDGKDDIYNDPLIKAEKRSLIDGDILFYPPNKEPKQIIEYLPGLFPSVLKVINAVCSVLLGILFFIMMVMLTLSIIKRLVWKIKHYSKYKVFINEFVGMDEERRSILLKNPFALSGFNYNMDSLSKEANFPLPEDKIWDNSSTSIIISVIVFSFIMEVVCITNLLMIIRF